jgi:hypothetical protein
MSCETPVQPVVARGTRAAVALLAVVVTMGLLLWQPWSAGPSSGVGPGPTASAPVVDTGSPAPVAVPPSTAPPYSSPRGLAVLPPGSFVSVPPSDAFRPRWSIVGITDLPDGEPRVLQLPVVTTSGFIEGRAPAEVCALGRLRTAVVVLLPASRYRLIGIAAPASGIAGPTELTRVDRVPLAAYEVALRPPEEARAAVRLFATADLVPWGEGAYRFLTEDGTGRPHFLYACVVAPSLVDGT